MDVFNFKRSDNYWEHESKVNYQIFRNIDQRHPNSKLHITQGRVFLNWFVDKTEKPESVADFKALSSPFIKIPTTGSWKILGWF